MRYPRNAKIFRGQLDLAPFVSVFFLLLTFVVLGSMVYTPGTPLRIVSAADLAADAKNPVIFIKKTGDISLLGRNYNLGTLDDFRAQLKKLPRGSTLRLARPEIGAPRELLSTVRDTVTRSGLRLENGSTIELPTSSQDSALEGPTIAVAIDLSGQFYFDNQFIQDGPLQEKLTAAAHKFPDTTLVVLADRQVDHETMNRLTEIAQKAGIRDVRMATRPRLMEPKAATPPPAK